MASAELPDLTELSIPTLEDLWYAVPPAITDNRVTAARALALTAFKRFDFRLTTESGVPVSTSDRTAQSTIYMTPLDSNLAGLYDGTRKMLYALPEIAIVLASLTTDKLYWIFAFTSASTPSSTNTSTDEITFGSAHGWQGGACARVATTGGGLTAGTNYFVRVVSSTVITLHSTLAGALANTGKVDLTASITAEVRAFSLELSAAWTTDNTPADAITTSAAGLEGVALKSGATTRRLVGLIRTTGTSTTEDSDAKRYVASFHNQVLRRLMKYQAEGTQHIATGSWREWNGGTGGPHRLYFVTCEVQTFNASGWAEINGTATGLAQVALTLNDAASEGLANGMAFGTGEFSFSHPNFCGAYVSALGYNELVVTELLQGSAATNTHNYYRAMATIMG